MIAKLFLLFTLVTTAEMILLVKLGAVMGFWWTVGLVVLTGFIGANLAKRAGMKVLSELRQEMAAGQLPADSLMNGAIVLVAGVFLMTPGILTDITGLLLMLPPVRALVRLWLKVRVSKWIADSMASGKVRFAANGVGFSSFSGFGGATPGAATPEELFGRSPFGPGVRVDSYRSETVRPAAPQRIYRDGDVIDVTEASESAGKS